MNQIKLKFNEGLPLEMHKVRIVQNLNLLRPVDRLVKIKEAGCNTFLLKSKDVFLDMLTDSGTNAMSDRQLAMMNIADDSYAGSESFFRLERKLQFFFGKKLFLPAHQGRACENIIAQSFVTKGSIIPMNYHFTTTKTHIELNGGKVVEVFNDNVADFDDLDRFKGNFNLEKLSTVLEENKNNIPFVRVEMGTNLIGGQPISLDNIEKASLLCKKYNIPLIMDASLLTDNLYFIKKFEHSEMTVHEIALKISSFADIIYFSARKLGSAKGGGIVTNVEEYHLKMRDLVPLYEGFLTYGGMSTREMEAITEGLNDALEMDFISQGPIFIEAFGKELEKYNVPIVKPTGGLGIHIDAKKFLSHLPQSVYPAGSLCAAIYLASGVRGMERGTISETRNEDGTDHFALCELVRLALPRRVFTLSQIKYAAERIGWLYQNRHLIGGLEFTDEPKIMRFFVGKLQEIGNWQENLIEQFQKEFPDSL